MIYFATVSIFLLAIVQYVIVDRKNNPSFIFSIYWTGWFIVAIYFENEFPVFPAGMWFVVVLSGLTFIGFLTGNYLALSTTPNYRTISNRNVRILVMISAIFGLLSAINLWISAYLDGVRIKSIYDFFDIATYYSSLRYGASDYSEPVLSRALNIILFSGCVLGGVLFVNKKTKCDTIISSLPLMSSLLLTVTLGTRASLLISGALYASGILSTLDFHGKSKINILNPKIWIMISIIIVLGSILFVSLQILRGGNEIGDLDASIAEDTFEHVKTSWLAPFPIFTHMFENYLSGDDNLALGGYSFFGPLSLIGVESQRNPAAIYYGSGVAGDTNVFSMFGFMLLDWGVVGMSILFFLFGILSGFAWRKVRQGGMIWLPMLAGAYSVVLWSIVHNIFSQITLVAAFVILLCMSFWSFPIANSSSH